MYQIEHRQDYIKSKYVSLLSCQGRTRKTDNSRGDRVRVGNESGEEESSMRWKRGERLLLSGEEQHNDNSLSQNRKHPERTQTCTSSIHSHFQSHFVHHFCLRALSLLLGFTYLWDFTSSLAEMQSIAVYV